MGDGVSSSSGTGAGVITLASVGKGVVNGVPTGGSVSGGRDTPGVGASVLFVPRAPSPPPSGSSMSPTAATRMSFASVVVVVVVVVAAEEDAVSLAAPWTPEVDAASDARPMTSAAAVLMENFIFLFWPSTLFFYILICWRENDVL